jgi:UDP-N-acetyl-D-mannosaminuronic acid transferase (WecB/TagA/CpsF family)
VVVNIDKLVKASRDAQLRRIIKACAPVWFYRFLQEPRRMFQRYFIEDMAFIWLLVKEAAHMRRR